MSAPPPKLENQGIFWVTFLSRGILVFGWSLALTLYHQGFGDFASVLLLNALQHFQHPPISISVHPKIQSHDFPIIKRSRQDKMIGKDRKLDYTQWDVREYPSYGSSVEAYPTREALPVAIILA